jgi:hypothetical protein
LSLFPKEIDIQLSKRLDIGLSIGYREDMTFADFDQALDWYVKSHFTAEDATRASGVSEAAQRDLQKRKIFSPVPQSRTAKRMLFGDTVKRLCIAGALNQCGIPLLAGSRIIHADTLIEDFLIHLVDPFQMFFDGYDKEAQRYIRRGGNPDPDGLYDPSKPVSAHRTDMFIEITNNRYVRVLRSADRDSWVLGELTNDKADFIVWKGRTFDHIVEGKKLHETLIDDAGLWAAPTHHPSDADEVVAQQACAAPLSKITVNAGMALRAGIRRLLYIDSTSAP